MCFQTLYKKINNSFKFLVVKVVTKHLLDDYKLTHLI